MVGAKLAFKTVFGELLRRHLCDGGVADQRVYPRHALQHLFGGGTYRGKFRKVHLHKVHVSIRAELRTKIIYGGG